MADIPSSSTDQKRTIQAFHRQVFWQITLPLILLALIFLTLTVLASLARAGSQSRWADISLIWCLCPNLLVMLLCVGLLGGISYGLFYLRKILPDKLFRIQDFSVKVREGVQKASDAAVEPVLKVHSRRAGQAAMRKSIRDLFKRPPRDEG